MSACLSVVSLLLLTQNWQFDTNNHNNKRCQPSTLLHRASGEAVVIYINANLICKALSSGLKAESSPKGGNRESKEANFKLLW